MNLMPRLSGTRCTRKAIFFLVALALTAVFLAPPRNAYAQQEVNWTAQEKPIYDQIKTLRSLPDDVRARTTKDIALEIRALPASENKLRLANYLASRATEGDFGHDTLQEVATTLAVALQQAPAAPDSQQAAAAYDELAQLVRYEHVQVSVNSPQYQAAMSKLEADDAMRQHIDFTLADLQGKTWTLKDLKGKVVLVNFWATWCPPCRKEMPDLEALSKRFADQGLVILALSDEEADKVQPFIAAQKITYPVLLDPDSKVHKQFEVEGIPKSFVYDREGKLVAQSIDMRTQRQFLEMLAQAGLQ